MAYQLIANLITGLNGILGLMAAFSAMHNEYKVAAYLVVFSVFLDAIDGKIARLNPDKAPSDFGKEFDSLADLISFGIAPSVLVYSFLEGLKNIFVLFCLSIYVVSGVFRLARFNIYSRQSQRPFFIGLPIPAAAGFISGLILLLIEYDIIINLNILLVIAVVLALLMASRIRYPNSLVLSGMGRKRITALGLAGILLLIFIPQIFIFGCFSIYLLASPLMFRKKLAVE